jgi:acyl dehydratase
MSERYFEDLRVGDRFVSGTYTVSESDIIRFADAFDPQPFHLDNAAAGQSIFSGLAASGWHTAAITMRLMVTSGMAIHGGLIGLGVDELRWPKAVRPGDTLQVQIEVLELKPSRSRPDRATMKIRSVTTNQAGEVVLTMVSTALVPRREEQK